MAVPTLEKLVEELSDLATTTPSGVPGSILHLINDKWEMAIVKLAVEMNSMVATIAQLVVAKQDPALAVFIAEAKTAKTRATVGEETDPDLQRLLRGEIRVSDLPRAKRQEMLILYGEDRRGNEAIRIWNTEPPSRHGERYKYTRLEGVETCHLASRLRPLYMYRELMATRHMTEYQARKHAREHATKELERMGMAEAGITEYAKMRGFPGFEMH